MTSQDGGRQGAGNRRTRTKSSGRWRREMVGASCGQGTADSVQKGRGQTFPEMDLQANPTSKHLVRTLSSGLKWWELYRKTNPQNNSMSRVKLFLLKYITWLNQKKNCKVNSLRYSDLIYIWFEKEKEILKMSILRKYNGVARGWGVVCLMWTDLQFYQMKSYRMDDGDCDTL